MFGPKKQTRQQIAQKFNDECQADLATGRPMDAPSYDAFAAEQKTIAFEILRYNLSYMRIHVNAKLTHEHGMGQRYLVMVNDYLRKGNGRAAQAMTEKANQCTAKMRVCNAFFRAIKGVVEK